MRSKSKIDQDVLIIDAAHTPEAVCFWCDEPAGPRRPLINHRGIGLCHKSCGAEFDASRRGRQKGAPTHSPSPADIITPEDLCQARSLREVIDILRARNWTDAMVEEAILRWQSNIPVFADLTDLPARVSRLLKAT